MAGALLTTISPLLVQMGWLRVAVVDPMGEAVGLAEAALCADLPLGDCRIRVTSPGYVALRG